MLSIRELKTTEKKLIPIIARLHKKSFPEFFLTQLGLPFLRTLYSGYLEDKNSGIITAFWNNKLVGIIAYSRDYSTFYKGLIKKHIFKFALCSICAAIMHPSFIKRLFGAFKKGDEVKRKEKYIELASICVDPFSEGKGIGTALIEFLKKSVDFREFSYINLETDAINNDEVNLFYKKNGFEIARKYTTAEGRRMNEYRFSPGVLK